MVSLSFHCAAEYAVAESRDDDDDVTTSATDAHPTVYRRYDDGFEVRSMTLSDIDVIVASYVDRESSFRDTISRWRCGRFRLRNEASTSARLTDL